MKRFGFITILGEPNVGKSTLLNHIVGAKVSIVSHKVQTTRRRLLGITVVDETQLVFVDTPGIFQPKKRLDRSMVKAAWNAANDTDINLLLIDCTADSFEQTTDILKSLNSSKKPLFVAFNKIDLASSDRIKQLIDTVLKEVNVKKIFQISAFKGQGISEMMKFFANVLPEGPWLYPEEQMTDIPLRFMAAELTREKIFHYLHQELPYDITVETEAWEEFKNGSVKVSQVIHVRRPGQKAIVLGKNGAQIKKISEIARRDLEQLLEKPVHLFIYVKVSENWMEDPYFYRTEGLDFEV